MDLRALKQAELLPGMSKIAETERADTNVGVRSRMTTAADIVLWQVRAKLFQSLDYSR
jgi:hypothetical protein